MLHKGQDVILKNLKLTIYQIVHISSVSKPVTFITLFHNSKCPATLCKNTHYVPVHAQKLTPPSSYLIIYRPLFA